MTHIICNKHFQLIIVDIHSLNKYIIIETIIQNLFNNLNTKLYETFNFDANYVSTSGIQCDFSLNRFEICQYKETPPPQPSHFRGIFWGDAAPRKSLNELHSQSRRLSAAMYHAEIVHYSTRSKVIVHSLAASHCCGVAHRVRLTQQSPLLRKRARQRYIEISRGRVC